MSQKKIIIKNILTSVFFRISALFITYFYINFIGRNISVADYGIFNLAVTLGSFILLFSDLGLNSYIFREIAKSPRQAKHYIDNSLIIRVILYTLILLVGSFLIFTLKLEPPFNFVLIIIMSANFIQGIGSLFFSVIRAYEKFEYVGLLENIYNLLNLILTVVLFQVLPNIFALGYAMLFSSCGQLVMALYFFHKLDLKIALFPIKFDLRAILTNVQKSISFALMGLIVFAYNKVDILMLKLLDTNYSIGLYSAAYKFFDLLGFVPVTIANAFLPVFSRSHQKKQIPKIVTIATKAFKYVFSLGLLCSVVMYVFAEYFVPLVWTAKFSSSIQVVKILALGLFVNFLNYFLSSLIIAMNKQKSISSITFIALLINVGLNFYFIPHYSYIGAALVTVISAIAVLLMYVVLLFNSDIKQVR